MKKPRQDYLSWDETFMRMAHLIAQRSKDPSTQTGAVIATTNNIVVGLGYNGAPRNIESEDIPWERDGDFENTKYAYVCHAEENAIYNANNSTKDCKLYCTLFPCNECTKTIIQNDIKEVIYDSDKYANSPASKVSRKLLKMANITVRQYSSEK